MGEEGRHQTSIAASGTAYGVETSMIETLQAEIPTETLSPLPPSNTPTETQIPTQTPSSTETRVPPTNTAPSPTPTAVLLPNIFEVASQLSEWMDGTEFIYIGVNFQYGPGYKAEWKAMGIDSFIFASEVERYAKNLGVYLLNRAEYDSELQMEF